MARILTILTLLLGVGCLATESTSADDLTPVDAIGPIGCIVLNQKLNPSDYSH